MLRIPSFSTAQRVTLAFALMIGLVLLASGSGFIASQSFSNTLEASESTLDKISAVASLETGWYQVVGSIDYMLLTRQTSLIAGRLADQLLIFTQAQAALAALPPSPNESQPEQNARLISTLTALNDDLNDNVDNVFNLALSGSWARAQAVRHTELAALQRRFTDSLTALEANIQADADAALATADERRTQTQQGWLTLSVLAIGVGVLAALVVPAQIVRPVNALAAAARAIELGDLSQRAPVSAAPEINALGRAFNSMTERLATNISTLETNVQQLVATNAERDTLIKELESALLFKDQFLATMSHELRTPLNAILGYTAILIDDTTEDGDGRYMLTRIEDNSRRLLSLINDVLNISRINANRVELVERPITIKTLAKSWFDDFRHQAAERGLVFEYTVDLTLPATALLDEERVTQITANLLQNAFKFTQQGGVYLTLNREGRDQWQIIVRDTGQGIPESWQHLIFDEFRQVDSGSRRKFGGAGLGLSIVKKLCLLMGGSVTVTSKLDVGSTFTVTLPLKTDQTTVNPAEQQKGREYGSLSPAS